MVFAYELWTRYGASVASNPPRLRYLPRRSVVVRTFISTSTIRLIDTKTLQLKEFTGGQIPPYAILSHTWNDDEVTLQDMQRLVEASKRLGFVKIWRTCLQARQDGIDYAWVDTCCIDKTSSSELTEAINSMFQWYAGSQICYVYLEDLPTERTASLRDCRWFTRGWTLQELIAPKEMKFFDAVWKFRGTKRDLEGTLRLASGIGADVLRDPSVLPTLSVAQRMSWASRRKTTRIEDEAYSLLGIFDVNMALLYGEGDRAFIRLQEEIAKSTNDMSLFVWKQQDAIPNYRGIFASSPSEFAESGYIVPRYGPSYSEEFALTNRGLRMKGEPIRATRGHYFLGLNCSYGYEPLEQVGIYLKHYGAGYLFARHKPHLLGRDNEAAMTPATKTIYISKTLGAAALSSVYRARHRAFHFRHGFEHVYIARSMPEGSWDPRNRIFLTGGQSNFVGILHMYSERWESSLTLVCALLAGATGAMVKFVNAEEVHTNFESVVLNQPHNILRLPQDMLLDQHLGVGLHIEIYEEVALGQTYDIFCIDLAETRK